MKLSFKKITTFISSIFSQRPDKSEIERLLRADEARLGGSLFGVNEHRRDFFQLDEQTWVWNEEINVGAQSRIITTRYTLTEQGVLKSQDGSSQTYVSGTEFDHLYEAIRLYDRHVRGYFAQLQS